MGQNGLNIAVKKLSDLNPSAYNPRKISDIALSGLTKSIERFGLVEPIIWNKRTGNVVGGHQRLKVLLAEGLKKTSVVVVDLPTTDEKALNVALNSPAISGEFTEDLNDILDQVQGELPDVYDELLLDELRIEPIEEIYEGQTDPDDIPDPSPEPISKTGDLWIMGNHRLLCGDCTKAEEVERLMAGERADILHTDPPYGINIVKVGGDKAFGKVGGDKAFGKVGGDKVCKANYYPVITNDDKPFHPAHLMGLTKIIILWGANYYAHNLKPHAGWIVWDKKEGWESNNFADCEMAWTNQDKPSRIFAWRWQGMIKKGEQGKKRVHPTQKPIALFAEINQVWAPDAQIWLDLYCGSGSQIIAAEQLNRRCYAMEIEPHYIDVAVKRWEEFTGNTATLDTTH